jgi:hypothetical protein
MMMMLMLMLLLLDGCGINAVFWKGLERRRYDDDLTLGVSGVQNNAFEKNRGDGRLMGGWLVSESTEHTRIQRHADGWRWILRRTTNSRMSQRETRPRALLPTLFQSDLIMCKNFLDVFLRVWTVTL